MWGESWELFFVRLSLIGSLGIQKVWDFSTEKEELELHHINSLRNDFHILATLIIPLEFPFRLPLDW